MDLNHTDRIYKTKMGNNKEESRRESRNNNRTDKVLTKMKGDERRLR